MIRRARPGLVSARCSSRRIWLLRLENTDSMISRMRALRSRLPDAGRACAGPG
jgi:hypothetical protein